MTTPYLILLIIGALCFVTFLFSYFILFRNNWVYKKRNILITYHHNLGIGNWRNFDKRYGTYDSWVNRFWIWNANKLAGVNYDN